MDRPTPTYVFGQLSKAIRAAGINATDHGPEEVAKANARAEEWKKIIQGVRDGLLSYGTRTPIKGVPEWVTPKVATGGFATGELMAEGPLLPHEEALLDRLGARNEANPRLFLNSYYLTEPGMLELARMLESGCYRIKVAEEGALLVIAWLLTQQKIQEAEEIMTHIQPWLPRLRFYPIPDTCPLSVSSIVSVAKVVDVNSALRQIRTPPKAAKMKRALEFWRPIEDEMVAIFLETLPAGEAPPLATRSAPTAAAPRGKLTVTGGAPCTVIPPGWLDRVKAFLAKNKADFAKQDFPSKHPYTRFFYDLLVKLTAPNPAQIAAQYFVRMRRMIGEINASRGLAGSERLAARRADYRECLASICGQQMAQVALERLKALPAADGIDNVAAYLGPITAEEAAKEPAVKAGMPLSARVRSTIERARKEDLYELVRLGLCPSSEVLATLVWDVSAQTRSAVFTDNALRQLYSMLYLAFRTRRSLLLLNLGGQTRMSDLPWCTHLESLLAAAQKTGEGASLGAKEALTQVVMVALEKFPETILPNKLLKELRSLVQSASLELPLVDELAADIFQHDFSAKFVLAAARTAAFVEGTLYAKYYSIPCAELKRLGEQQQGNKNDTAPAKAFYQLCRTRSGVTNTARYWAVSQTGTLLEQEAVLTSHNLACLFAQLGLLERLGPRRLAALPRACLEFILKSLQNLPLHGSAMFAAVRFAGFAWRQMVFFLSFVTPDERRDFFVHSRHCLDELKDQQLAARLKPAFRALMSADQGGAVDLVFYGWSTQSHWVLPTAEDKAKAEASKTAQKLT